MFGAREEWHFELSSYRRLIGFTMMLARMQKAICVWSISMRNSSPVRNMKQPLFLKRYIHWKEATIAFKKHQTSEWHCEAMKVLLVLPQCITNLANLQNAVILFTKFTQSNLRTLILQRSPGDMSPDPPSYSTLCMFDCST